MHEDFIFKSRINLDVIYIMWRERIGIELQAALINYSYRLFIQQQLLLCLVNEQNVYLISILSLPLTCFHLCDDCLSGLSSTSYESHARQKPYIENRVTLLGPQGLSGQHKFWYNFSSLVGFNEGIILLHPYF